MSENTHRLVTVATVLAIGYLLTRPAATVTSPPHLAPVVNEAPGLSSSSFRRSAKGRRLGAFYQQFAEVVERDAGAIVLTLSQFRQAHNRALRLAYRGTPTADGVKVGAEIDAVLLRAIGGSLDERAIDDELRARIVQGLRDVAELCGARNGEEKTE